MFKGSDLTCSQQDKKKVGWSWARSSSHCNFGCRPLSVLDDCTILWFGVGHQPESQNTTSHSGKHALGQWLSGFNYRIILVSDLIDLIDHEAFLWERTTRAVSDQIIMRTIRTHFSFYFFPWWWQVNKEPATSYHRLLSIVIDDAAWRLGTQEENALNKWVHEANQVTCGLILAPRLPMNPE